MSEIPGTADANDPIIVKQRQPNGATKVNLKMTLTSSTNMLGDDNSPKRQGLAQKGMKSTTHEFMNTRSSGDTSNQNMHPASGGVTFHQEQSWLL